MLMGGLHGAEDLVGFLGGGVVLGGRRFAVAAHHLAVPQAQLAVVLPHLLLDLAGLARGFAQQFEGGFVGQQVFHLVEE